jgi:hypothetical protein
MACRTAHYRQLGTLLTGAKSGEDNPRWKGGRMNSNGYVMVLRPDHPHAGVKGYVSEHRLVMEAHLGRRLNRSEVVHHRNHDKTDNRIENLELFADNREHKRIEHQRGENLLTSRKH